MIKVKIQVKEIDFIVIKKHNDLKQNSLLTYSISSSNDFKYKEEENKKK